MQNEGEPLPRNVGDSNKKKEEMEEKTAENQSPILTEVFRAIFLLI